MPLTTSLSSSETHILLNVASGISVLVIQYEQSVACKLIEYKMEVLVL